MNRIAAIIAFLAHYFVAVMSKGVIFTEGSYDNPDCFARHEDVDGPSSVHFSIPFHDCKTQQTEGEYRNTLVVQRHPRIMTGEDGAFALSCSIKSQSSEVEIVGEDAAQEPVEIDAAMELGPANKEQEELEESPVESDDADVEVTSKLEYYGKANKKGPKVLYSDEGTYTYLPAKNGTKEKKAQIDAILMSL